MKKLFSILLCVALLATLTPSAFAAATSKDTISDTVWTFSESQTVSDYGTPGNTGKGSVELAANSGANGTGDAALAITRNPSDGSNVYIDFLSQYQTKLKPQELKVKFDFNVNNTNAKFQFIFKDSKDYNVLVIKDGKINFLGVQVATGLSIDTWYNIEMSFNIPMGYGQLKYKAKSASAFTTYDVFANGDSGMLNGKTDTLRLGAGIYDGNGSTVLIDNYYQNYADVVPQVMPAEDFSGGIDSWTQTNITGKDYMEKACYTAPDGNKMLMIKGTNATAATNANMAKSLSSVTTSKAALNTNYVFKFKFGGDAAGSAIGASLQAAGNSNKEIFIVNNYNNIPYLFGDIGASNGTIKVEDALGTCNSAAMYEVEAVYNPSTSTLTAVLTNEDGTQVVGSDGRLAGLPTRFAFRNCVGNGASSVAYFDDFETTVLDTNGPVFVSSEVLSGDTDCADLDETAVFTYDRTIHQAELANATVTLNNETLSKDAYSITSKGNKVLVTLKGLELGTEYTVGLSGVKDILGTVSADEAEAVTFTTSKVAITATQPVLNGTVLSTNVTSYYANGKTLKLIVAVYDAGETMIEKVKVATITADDRNGETLSYDFAEILGDTNGKKVKGFVWSDFDSMTPYAAAYK
ncbi:MAG: hypothetical protein IKV73_07230 [Clostridia bacterium]|nr:hypothetical protein [Clostridia bacterium]